MSGYYKNSLVIDFTVVPARPKLERVREFVFEQMGIQMSQIKNLQTRIIKAQVIIEVESAEEAAELATTHNLQHPVEHEGQQYPIPVYTADNIKEIRVFDLPCQMPNSVIAKYLASYGEVISIKDDIWKDVFTGVANGTRLVRMKLEKQIPSYVMMSGIMAFVTYGGQTRTCKHCSFPLHIGKPCSQNRKDLLSSGLTAAQMLQFPALGRPGTSRMAPLGPQPGAATGDNVPVGTGAHQVFAPNKSQEESASPPSAAESDEVNHESAKNEEGDMQVDFIISDEESRLEEQSASLEKEDTQHPHRQASNHESDTHIADRNQTREISISQPDQHNSASEQRQIRPRDGSSGSGRGRSSSTTSGKRHLSGSGSPNLNETKRKLRQQK